ncbi:MAG: EAL domain-containing protein [Sedimenticola sp.]
MNNDLSVSWYDLEPMVDRSGRPVMFELLYRSHSTMPQGKGDWRRWYQRIGADLDNLMSEQIPVVALNLDCSHLLDMKVLASIYAAGKQYGNRICLELRNPGNRYLDRVEQALSVLREPLGMQLCIDSVTPETDVTQLLSLKPDWIKIAPNAFNQSIATTAGCEKLGSTIEQYHNAGVKVAIVGIEKQIQERLARRLGADLTQGHLWNDKCLNGKNIEAITYTSTMSNSDISLIRHLVSEHEKNLKKSFSAPPPWALKVRELVQQVSQKESDGISGGEYVEADSECA